jgi:shikimate dehydrogenase
VDQPAELIRLALFGSPVRYSLSPRIHTAFATQTGLEVEYTAIESDEETFPARLSVFARAGGLGCNITAPLKHLAYRLAADTDDDAQRAGAANTFLRRKDGGWSASNTDGAGLVHDLQSGLGIALASFRICILGAGGAVAGILASLLKASPSDIVIVNRTLSRAVTLAQRHRQAGDIQVETPDQIEKMAPFDLVINATSLGHHGKTPRLPSSLLATEGLCYDLNYGAASHPLRDHCQRNNIRYSDGLGMLVAQAGVSFELWTGQQPDVAGIIAKLRGMDF